MQLPLVGKIFNRQRSRSGFTIVELLIVVVVIAILAAITIIAYSGITQRTKDTTAQSAATQATKKLALYAVDNSDLYPPDEATFLTYANLQDSGTGTSSAPSYQYTISSDRRTFCLTTTTNSLSYFTSNAAQTPQKGACPGHGVNGGGVVTNLVLNPKLGVDSTGWTASAGSGGTASLTRVDTGGPSGVAASFARTEWTVASTSPGVVSVGQTASQGAPVNAGASYVPSMYVRSSVALTVYVDSIVYSSSSGIVLDSPQTNVALAANTWTRIQGVTYTTPSGAATASVRLVTSGSVASGVKLDATAVMLNLSTPTSAYADGDTAGWSWNGTSNNSTSTGPPQ